MRVNTPNAHYQKAVDNGMIADDPLQREVCGHLNRLFLSYCDKVEGWRGLWRRFRALIRCPSAPLQGVYLWGSVGRGKTYVMDLFFHCLPPSRKKRLHFHRFMYWVHEQLTARQGQIDPLQRIAKDFAKQYDILCFDELFVSDIADAMILGDLFQALFAEGITLVATSNLPPQKLYENGLQRQKFLPAIEAIQTHMQEITLEGKEDYRLTHLEHMPLYLSPLNENTAIQMQESFSSLSTDSVPDKAIEIAGRSIPSVQYAPGIVWFEFSAICQSARSASDYIELARCFHTVFVSNVTAMGPAQEDAARRFISLVDEFYERAVKLIMSASTPIESLYDGQLHHFAFQRTISRLHEMQSAYYLGKPHLT